MKTLVMIMMALGFSAYAKNASCKAMNSVHMMASSNPPTKQVIKAVPKNIKAPGQR